MTQLGQSYREKCVRCDGSGSIHEMAPTMKLRWGDYSQEDCDRDVPRAEVVGWPEQGSSYYKLQQWWEDGDGHGEWRDVPKE
jgi:hypothetical protein